MTLEQMKVLTLEQLAIELPESRFGRGILIERSIAEGSRSGSLAGFWEIAKRKCRDRDRLARAEHLKRRRTRELFALWDLLKIGSVPPSSDGRSRRA